MDPQKFKALLETEHPTWPCAFTFKFVAERRVLDQVLGLLPTVTPTVRPSRRERFVGVTFQTEVASSDDVIAVYQRAQQIESVIAL